MDKFVSAMLSLILPGLGQFYNKENKKGVLFLLVGIVFSFHPVTFIVIRLIVAAEAYMVVDRIEKGEVEPEEEYESTEEEEVKPTASAEPVEAPNEEEAPVAAPSESKEEILLKTLLDITTEDRYYQFDEIRSGMEARYGTPQTWLTNAWVGRKLGPLGFTDKRRLASGTEVKLTASEVLNLARKKGLF